MIEPQIKCQNGLTWACRRLFVGMLVYVSTVSLAVVACELATSVRIPRDGVVAVVLVAVLLFRFYLPYFRSRVKMPVRSPALIVYWLFVFACVWLVILAGFHISTWYESRRGLSVWTLVVTGLAYVICTLITDFLATTHLQPKKSIKPIPGQENATGRGDHHGGHQP